MRGIFSVACVGGTLGAFIFVSMLHPCWSAWLMSLGLVLFGFVASKPASFGLLFPLLLVMGDAYPLTGQLLIQEYDSLLLACVAGVLWNRTATQAICESSGGKHLKAPRSTSMRRACGVGVILMIASVLISGWRGWNALLPTPLEDQVSVYFSHQNAIRIGKGYFWGLLYFVLERSWGDANHPEWRRWYAAGVQLSIVYVAVVIVAERLVYESLWEFEREYRATGPFFTMHIGDQHVDAFITLALPWAWAMRNGLHWKTLSISMSLLMLMAVATIYTMSRATIVAVAVQILLLGFLIAIRVPWRRGSGLWLRRLMPIGAIAMIASLVGVVLGASSIRARFDTLHEDWATRWTHWQDLIGNDRWTWGQRLWGRGLGTVPTEFAHQQGLPVPPVRWVANGTGGELHLRGGWPMYIEQYRWPVDRRSERVSIRVRSKQASLHPGDLSIYRCRKSMLHSYDQVGVDGAELAMAGEREQGLSSWAIQTDLPSVAVQAGVSSLGNWGAEACGIHVAKDVECVIESLSLNAEAAGEKGDLMFPIGTQRRGSFPWAFTCDDHMVWRAKNGMVHVLFEQGWLGLATWGWWVLLALAAALRGCCSCQSESANSCGLALVAIIGFGIVSSFGTLLDTPWITALLFSVLSSVFAPCEQDTQGPVAKPLQPASGEPAELFT